ncbi:hypothetical protein A2303_04635 [Candidatus Falkowbacteria bacterium RIFOXYB2_FULL_47_14]|uniref:Glycosyltransferase subfamily 4-like N-terminal domain-containing protein n=1 Tax=Candidatus Falkowbacteria bacterium RIFOXYA2_FULL_47_19 TaxID=1797994 RepID=A0A1F5SHB1_9BACT|nr:MAG: hypothetical protein A2227_02470 [Candidatus Falkowbacteria bacterium RIFOXYA2_FULL_47_19]OGF35789.1 MAG: hypothetical protein A2468_03655 [Candidatus Falkowbacteria bacterium RIFOXYC2_FULL_46_15]OGF42662.1 MAG: hypothetical protein A2303_04635 [Candidatus Falkowbacteria bacterium RIFOXYB2_FULL_47_14]
MNLARSFNKIMGKDYRLVVAKKKLEQIPDVNTLSLELDFRSKIARIKFLLPYLYCFFWLPFYVKKNALDSKDTVIFTNDPNFLLLIIWWRKMCNYQYKICSDWHMLFGNFKDGYNARNSDFLITTSEKLKRQLIEKCGADERKIKVVYGGVDLSNYSGGENGNLKKGLGLPTDKILVGYVGFYKTIGMSKGIDTMIRTLPLLEGNIVMAFVGGWKHEIDEYLEMARDMGVDKRCIFVEKVSVEMAAKYEMAMDILTIPYPDKPHFRDYGFPMKVYEYMAAGKPIVYSALELTEEVLHDCGFTFRPDDAVALADKIKYIIDKKNERVVKMSVETASKKVAGLTWEKKAGEIINLVNYAKSINNHPNL